MSTAENILARVKRLLAEKEAKLVSYAAVTVVREGTGTTRQSIRMTRKWERIDDLIRKDLEDYLRTYASVSNNDVEGIYVTDPWADGEIRAGRWRMVRVFSSPLKTDPKEQGIFQTLMYWPDGYGDFGDYCAQSSPLHHEDVEVFVDSPVLATANHQNTIGHIYSASNHLDLETGLWSGEERDDKARYFGIEKGYSGSATEEIERIAARNDSAAYPNQSEFSSIVSAKKSVQANFSINQYGLIDWEAAISEPQAYPTDADGQQHIHGNVTTKETTSERINDESIPADDWPATAGITNGLDFTITPEGRFHWTHNKRESQEYPEGGAGLSTWSYGPLSKEEKREGRNASATPVATDPGTYAAGSIIRSDFSINPDGFLDWSKVTDTALVYPVVPAQVVYGGPLETNTHTEGRNAADVPSIVPGTQGTVKRADFTINQYGLYDWSTDVQEAVKPALIEYETGGPLAITDHKKQLNDTAYPQSEAGAAGHITGASVDINRFGLYDWTTEDEEAQPSVLIEWETGNLLSPTSHQKQLNDTTYPDIAAGQQGHVINGYVDINRYGLYDWTMEDEEGVKPLIIEWQTGGPLAATDHEKQLNDTTYPDIAAGGQGHLSNATISLNRFGLFDWDKEDDAAATPDPIEWKTGGPLAEVSHTRQLNDVAPPTIVAGSQGHVVDARIDINRYGLFDWDKEDDAAATPNPIEWQTGGPLTTVDHTKQINDTSYPAIIAGASGHIVSGTVAINRYGLFDWEKTDEACVAASQTFQETSISEITDGVAFENQATVPDYPTATGYGTAIVRVQVSINRFGWLDGAISVTTATTGFSTESITLEDSYQQKVERKWYFNQETVPAGASKSVSGGDVTLKTYSPELNRFGLWDYSETTTTIRTGWSATSYHEYDPIYTVRTENDTMILYQRYKHRYTHTIAIHTTMAEAQAAISGKLTGSSTREIGGGLFMSDGVDVTEEFQNQVVVMKK